LGVDTGSLLGYNLNSERHHQPQERRYAMKKSDVIDNGIAYSDGDSFYRGQCFRIERIASKDGYGNWFSWEVYFCDGSSHISETLTGTYDGAINSAQSLIDCRLDQ
jgi:hypothetical protein